MQKNWVRHKSPKPASLSIDEVSFEIGGQVKIQAKPKMNKNVESKKRHLKKSPELLTPGDFGSVGSGLGRGSHESVGINQNNGQDQQQSPFSNTQNRNNHPSQRSRGQGRGVYFSKRR